MRIRWIALALAALLLAPPAAHAQDAGERTDALEALEARVAQVEREMGSVKSDVHTLERNVIQLADAGALGSASVSGVLFLMAVFCAVWAQNTRRNPWLWFFLGFSFHVFALFVLLFKNADQNHPASSR